MPCRAQHHQGNRLHECCGQQGCSPLHKGHNIPSWVVPMHLAGTAARPLAGEFVTALTKRACLVWRRQRPGPHRRARRAHAAGGHRGRARPAAGAAGLLRAPGLRDQAGLREWGSLPPCSVALAPPGAAVVSSSSCCLAAISLRVHPARRQYWQSHALTGSAVSPCLAISHSGQSCCCKMHLMLM